MEGDFIGFSFDGVHSSQLGIIRVSEGDRYSEILQPEFEDQLLPIPGGGGQYYFGSNYRERHINISIAFDSMTEEQMRQLTRLFSTTKPCSLIFDERPYKVYTVKLASPIQLHYVCFDNFKQTNNGKNRIAKYLKQYTDSNIGNRMKNSTEKYRVYKGDGSIEFICTSLYAYAPFKTLDSYLRNGYPITTYTNIDQWAAASGILSAEAYNASRIDKAVVPQVTGDINWKSQITVYNPGDIDSPFQLYLPFDNNGIIKGNSNRANVRIQVGNELMYFDTIRRKDKRDSGIIINTDNHLIEGTIGQKEKGVWIRTGTVYNQYLIAGDFPKILHQDLFEKTQVGASIIKKVPNQFILIDYNGAASKPIIDYRYLYY